MVFCAPNPQNTKISLWKTLVDYLQSFFYWVKLQKKASITQVKGLSRVEQKGFTTTSLQKVVVAFSSFFSLLSFFSDTTKTKGTHKM